MTVTASLMRNSDGSIYHLQLQPGQLAETIILVGDPQRSHLISSYFDSIEFAQHHREFATFTGRSQGKRISVLSTGVGAGGIDIAINEADALFNMDLETGKPKEKITQLQFVRFGTTGSLQADLPVGSLVTSAYAFATDGLLHYYTRKPPSSVQSLEKSLRTYFSDMPLMQGVYAAQADAGLMDIFEPIVAANGITFTCNGFFGPQGRELRQPLPLPNFIDWVSSFEFEGLKTTNLEMETAVIYGLCEVLGHKACSISAVMANRCEDSVGRYGVVVQDMVAHLFERLISKL